MAQTYTKEKIDELIQESAHESTISCELSSFNDWNVLHQALSFGNIPNTAIARITVSDEVLQTLSSKEYDFIKFTYGANEPIFFHKDGEGNYVSATTTNFQYLDQGIVIVRLYTYQGYVELDMSTIRYNTPDSSTLPFVDGLQINDRKYILTSYVYDFRFTNEDKANVSSLLSGTISEFTTTASNGYNYPNLFRRSDICAITDSNDKKYFLKKEYSDTGYAYGSTRYSLALSPDVVIYAEYVDDTHVKIWRKDTPKLYLISFDKFGNAGQTYCRFYSKTPITTFSELYAYLETNGYTISNKLTIFGNCDGNKSGTTKIVTGHPINIYYNSAYNTVGVTYDRYIYTLSIVDNAVSISTELNVSTLSISSTDSIHLKCEEVR